MSEDAPPPPPLARQVEQLRPRAGCFFLLIPILGVPATFLAYAWLLWNGMAGRPASGPEVALRFEGCAEAGEVVAARLDEMGLPHGPVEAAPGGLSVRASLPAADTDPAAFAAVLATPGRFSLRNGDEELANEADITYAGVRLDVMMSPSTLVTLRPEARDRVYARMGDDPGGRSTMSLDGVAVWTFSHQTPSMNGEFEIPPDAADDRARMELAAARGVVLNQGPLPCPLRAVGSP